MRKSRLWKTFTSLKFAMIIILIIIILSIIGTVIPQNESPNTYIQRFETMGNFIVSLNLYQIYNTVYYRFFLLILGISILLCSIDKIIEVKKILSHRLFQMGEIDKIEKTNKFEILKNLSSLTPDTVHSFLDSCKYSVQINQVQDKTLILARKGIIDRIGLIITHLSIILIFFGGVITGYKGFTKSINIAEKEVLQIPEGDFSIRLNNFKIEYYKNKKYSDYIKDYISSVTVIDKDKEVFTKNMRVNHPVSYNGISFYQSSYGTLDNVISMTLKIQKEDSKTSKLLHVKLGEKFKLDNFTIQVTRFFNDFVIGDDGAPANKSNNLNNPACEILVKSGDKSFKFYSFTYYGIPHLPESFPYTIQPVDFQPIYYSGIQMSKDPGWPFIFIGFVLFMFGLISTLYSYYRWFYIIIDGSTFKITGRSLKYKEQFNKEYNSLINKIQSLKGCA